jgi:hypothetical protein
MTELKEVHDKVFDLSDTRDLSEIEHMCQRPDKYKFQCDETILLPFRHIRYEVIRTEIK